MLVKDILFGYYDTQCLYTVTKLNIADHLLSGPKSISELAQLTQTNEKKLFRIMRFMSAKSLFDELPNKVFQLNQESKYLVSSMPDSLHNFIYLHAEYFYQAASEISNGIKTDLSPFEIKFGKLADTYLKENAKASQIYNNAMKENSELYGKIISETYDFSSYETIVDVGGGIGSLLVNILLKNINSRGINYDLPKLQKTAELYFKEKEVESRCQFIGGDFFKNIPQGGNIYMLKAIIHGKNDAVALEILNLCKEVLPQHGKLLVIERIICKDEKNYINACVNDINMLNVTHGHVRTLPEFEELFKKSGYSITQIYALHDALSIIEVEVTRR